ncbi:hypothetical protein WJX73_002803 [Symbiochloris irregularis]|uniref:EamA domain-containing protein n=1 Tax=Symbiochloris irregularis TaxID=706552 RepID=A0AAW1P265_9CHLO
MGATSTQLANTGVSLPTTQSFINYVLLAALFGGTLVYSKRPLQNAWYKYAALAVLDVEANYLLITAYRFTSITSVTLLDCFTIPVAVVLSWWVLRARYGALHWAGIAICVGGLVFLVVTESSGSTSSGSAPFLGDAIVLLGATMYGICNVFQEKFLGNSGTVEVLAMAGTFGALLSGVQALILEHNELWHLQWSGQVVGLMFGFGLALFVFACLGPLVLMWSGSAAFNLSLLTSDLWAGLARILFFGGFDSRQGWSFASSLLLTASGITIYTAGKSPYDPAGAQQDSIDINLPDRLEAADILKLRDGQDKLSLVGFGSLLSIRSARSTFPELTSFQVARVNNFRRVFAHTAAVFHKNGIARPSTKEIASLSCEECPDQAIVTSLFQIQADMKSVEAFIDREHEFRFLAVDVNLLDGRQWPHKAVICGRWNDSDYRRERCSDEVWHERYAQYGLQQVWSDDVLPCRVYLRHCVLSAENLGPEAYDSFLDCTYLSDRTTTIRSYLEQHPSIMQEQPPDSLIGRAQRRHAQMTSACHGSSLRSTGPWQNT